MSRSTKVSILKTKFFTTNSNFGIEPMTACLVDTSGGILYETKDFTKSDMLGLEFSNSVNKPIMQKSIMRLLASYFKDGKDYVGQLDHVPGIATFDKSPEKLKDSLIDAYCLMHNLDLETLEVEIILHESKELASAYQGL